MEADQKNQKEVAVGLSFYFPYIKKFDLVHDEHDPADVVVPWCKAIVGYQSESNNGEASYIDNIK